MVDSPSLFPHGIRVLRIRGGGHGRLPWRHYMVPPDRTLPRCQPGCFRHRLASSYQSVCIFVFSVRCGKLIQCVTSSHRSDNDFTVTLPVDARSTLEDKSWDELSLKMPEITAHVAVPSSTHLTNVGSNTPEHPEDPAHAKDNDYLSKGCDSLSLAESKRLASFDISESSVVTVRQIPPPSTHRHNFQNLPSSPPTVTVTGTEQVIFSGPQRVLSPTMSRPTSYRRSTSTDLEINVSPAYFPHAGSRRHEEVPLTPTTFSDENQSRPMFEDSQRS